MKLLSKVFVWVLFVYSTSSHAQVIYKWKLQDMKNAIADAKEPTVFNFWATFCKPCAHEIPYFQQLVKKYKSSGLKLVLVSLDMKEFYPTKIRTFAKQRKFTAPIAFLDETNADVFCPAVDSSWSGALPASLFINNKIQYRSFYEGELTKEKFEGYLKEMVQKK